MVSWLCTTWLRIICMHQRCDSLCTLQVVHCIATLTPRRWKRRGISCQIPYAQKSHQLRVGALGESTGRYHRDEMRWKEDKIPDAKPTTTPNGGSHKLWIRAEKHITYVRCRSPPYTFKLMHFFRRDRYSPSLTLSGIQYELQ